MGVVRYYSDPHFHHRNMAIKRGFADETEMNEFIVQEWNKVVGKKDVTRILGDITMEKNNYEILNRLNGYKQVILGNHDRPQHIQTLLRYVDSVQSMKYIKDPEYGKFILTHAPIHPCELEYRWPVNIHGHVHENHVKTLVPGVMYMEEVNDSRYWNVCAEVIDYKPKLISELYELNRNF